MLFSVDGYRIVVMPVAIGIAQKPAEAKPEAVAETEDKPKRPSVRRKPVAVA